MQVNQLTSMETLQSALAYLLSRHSMIMSRQQEGCAACSALSITQHLELLVDHPDLTHRVLHNTYQHLLNDWRIQAESMEQQSAMRYKTKNQQTLQIH